MIIYDHVTTIKAYAETSEHPSQWYASAIFIAILPPLTFTFFLAMEYPILAAVACAFCLGAFTVYMPSHQKSGMNVYTEIKPKRKREVGLLKALKVSSLRKFQRLLKLPNCVFSFKRGAKGQTKQICSYQIPP
jgi:hypothetical protein